MPGTELKVGDVVLVEAGDLIPSDGEVIAGVASVNEAAITGESAPVIRESGGDRSAVTGGTQVLSDVIKVRITAAAGSTFVDRMIALVEGASRQKTPNEIALNILLAGLTLVFVFAVASIPSFASYAGGAIPVIVLVALFVTLIPTTIGALLSAIGIAGMDRLVRFNVLAMSGRAVEAAGDVDTLLLDKTGTITLGNRQATEFRPVSRRHASRNSPTRRSSPPWPTRRRRAARSWCSPRRSTASAPATWPRSTPPSCRSPRSPACRGVDLDGASIRKGAVDAVIASLSGQPVASRGSNAALAFQPAPETQAVGEIRAIAEDDRQGRRHAPRGRPRRPAARRRLPEGHREGRHPGALRGAAPDGHPHGDDHRRQPDDGGGDRRRGRASTTSSPRRPRRTSWR